MSNLNASWQEICGQAAVGCRGHYGLQSLECVDQWGCHSFTGDGVEQAIMQSDDQVTQGCRQGCEPSARQ